MGKNKLFWETTNECGSMGFVAVHKSEGNPPIAWRSARHLKGIKEGRYKEQKPARVGLLSSTAPFLQGGCSIILTQRAMTWYVAPASPCFSAYTFFPFLGWGYILSYNLAFNGQAPKHRRRRNMRFQSVVFSEAFQLTENTFQTYKETFEYG